MATNQGRDKMATATVERGKRQTEIPGMPQSALGRYASDFCEQKDRIDSEKEKLNRIGMDIVGVMKKESRRIFTINYEGEKFRFEVIQGAEKLKCTKSRPIE